MRLRLRSSIRIVLGRSPVGDRPAPRQLRLGRADFGGEAARIRRQLSGAAIVAYGVRRTLRTLQSIPQGNEQHRIAGTPTNGIVASVQTFPTTAARGGVVDR